MRLGGSEAVRRLADFPVFSSGAPALDRLLGGGFRGGKVYVVYGRSNSGKSQLAMQAALCASRDGTNSLYVDTEGAFRPERLESVAAARGWTGPHLLERVVYLRCTAASEQSEVVRRMSKRPETSSCRLVLVDTFTRNFALEIPGERNMPDRQGAIDAYLSEVARDAAINGRAYVLTNRVTFDRTGADVGIGGRTVAQLASQSIHLERNGAVVKATVVGGGGECGLRLDKAGVTDSGQ